MRRLLFIACGCAVAVGGGAIALASAGASDPPDLAACELHVRANLPTGVGYRQVSVTRVDSGPLTAPDFKRQAGASASVHGLGEAEELRDLADEMLAKSGQLALRRMVLTYQLDGERHPREQVCAFRLTEGKLDKADTLNAHATTQIGKAIELLADRKKWPRQTKPKHSCCL